MSGQYFRPRTCYAKSRPSAAPAWAPNEAPDSPVTKRQRASYEGEPDTSKWAVQPAPDIFTGTDHTIIEQPSEPAPVDPAEPADEFANLHVSPEVLRQLQELCMAQHGFERRLWEHRQAIERENEKAMQQLLAREMVHSVSSKEKEEMARQHRLALERADRRAIEKLDDLRYRQQMMLQSMGVPEFFPSSSVDVMERQQRILHHLLNPLQ
ncbi:hypothetical protein DL89DRAFT_281088 [Linderina pennispora]|uniref:Uncharacterized protein n=1 Tax=Linderina pennispora TaxID=61395 RepID=A0A1Y1WNE4_9FUNG|nr:uncharacterized protein DL89DRAFT_281088 [Linderina pennispora]ORX74746.1 hypothetical protein DL89DRAFT_281088 [Linderina pennispora]